MKAEDIVKGSLVIIKHSKEGGEVIKKPHRREVSHKSCKDESQCNWG